MLSIAQWDSSTGAYRVHLCVLPKIFPNVSLKLLIVQVTVVKPTPQSACWTPRSKHYKVQCSAKRLCAVLSRVWFFATPWTLTHQASLSMEFSRHKHWSGLPFPSPEDLLYPGIKPASLESPTLQADSLPLCHLFYLYLKRSWSVISKSIKQSYARGYRICIQRTKQRTKSSSFQSKTLERRSLKHHQFSIKWCSHIFQEPYKSLKPLHNCVCQKNTRSQNSQFYGHS